VGAAGVDARAALPAAVEALAGLSDLPLVLDNTDPDALEAAPETVSLIRSFSPPTRYRSLRPR